MENVFRQQLEQTCKRCKDNNAISYLRENEKIDYFSYAKLMENVQKIENELTVVGVKKADRVAIISPHSPYGVMAGTALAYMGCTAVMVDVSLPIIEITRLLEEGDVVAAFVDVEMQDKIGWNILGDYPIFDLNGDVPFKLSEKGLLTSRVCKIQDQDEEIMAIIFSSGTTSKMKGICIPYQLITESISMYRYLTGVEVNDRYLYVLPFNHIAGFSGALQHLLMGCELDMIEKMDSAKLSKGFQIFQPHYFAMVPKVYEIIAEKILGEAQKQGKEKTLQKMMSVSRFMRKKFGINIGKVIFGSVRSQAFGKCMKGIGVGASPCKKETADFFLALGYDWANFYSSTETGVPAVATGIHDRYPDDTVGNIHQFKEIDIQLINKDKDGIGEIAVKSPLGMKGYFRNEKLTKEAFNKDGYILTGDLGQINSKGYLQVVGRAKEVIILHNGKKVSPYDIEEMYASQMETPVELVCCGIENERDGYDEIHLFIEQTRNAEQITKSIKEISNQLQGIYKVEQVHVVSQFPKTAVGKVKRSELVNSVKHNDKKENATVQNSMSDENIIKEIVCKVSGCDEIKDIKWTLQNELQLDSLQLFELAVEIEKVFGCNIVTQFATIQTVEDLISIIRKGVIDEKSADTDYDINDFPVVRGRKTIKRLKKWMQLSHLLWKFDVEGLENIPSKGNYILAPNHESHLDGLWVLSCLQNSNMQYEKFCCLAKQEHLDADFSRIFMNMLGGIPVDRTGNSTKALRRAVECVKQGYYLLIHPEGTRTRDGKMGKFKDGTALVAQQTGVPIIPVRIKGAREVYPPNRKMPHLFDFKKMRRYRIKIAFCSPIQPNSNYEFVTKELKGAVENCDG